MSEIFILIRSNENPCSNIIILFSCNWNIKIQNSRMWCNRKIITYCNTLEPLEISISSVFHTVLIFFDNAGCQVFQIEEMID